MRKPIAAALALYVALLTCPSPAVSLDPGDAKIAHFFAPFGTPRMEIPEDFLEFANHHGYAYVIYNAGFEHDEWNRTGEYDFTGSLGLREQLTDEFLKADRYGLRLIPNFSINSFSLTTWGVTQKNRTDRWRDDWNIVTFQRGQRTLTRALPPFAREARFDGTFESYLRVIRSAFTTAVTRGLSYDVLDFIHLGYDELSLPGGELIIATTSNVDREFIRTNGNNASAYYALMADHIIRRVDAVRRVFGDGTRTIFYADTWDRRSRNATELVAWSSNGRRSIRINGSAVIRRTELASVRDYLVFMPWAYGSNLPGTYAPYDAEDAVRHFAERGFSVIPATAYESWGGDGVHRANQSMMKEWVRVSSLVELRQNVAGLAALFWGDPPQVPYWSEQPWPARQFDLLPELAWEGRFYERTLRNANLMCYRPGTGRAWVARSNSDGTFTTVYASTARRARGRKGTTRWTGIGGYDLRDVRDQAVAFDYDADLDDDLLLYRPGHGIAWVIRSNGNGRFTPVYITTDHGPIGGYDLLSTRDRAVALDYDADGDDDLLLYRPGHGIAWVIRSNGDGSFTPVYITTDHGPIGGYDLLHVRDSAVALDYDADGYDDLLLYRPGHGIAWVLRSNGDGSFTDVYITTDHGPIGGYDLLHVRDRAVALDYDADGDDDLLLYRPGHGIAWVLRSNGNGTFTDVYITTDHGPIGGYDLLDVRDSAVALDYDADGYDDLVLYRPKQGAAWVLRSNGDGTFTPVHIVPDNGSEHPNGIAMCDFLSPRDVALSLRGTP